MSKVFFLLVFQFGGSGISGGFFDEFASRRDTSSKGQYIRGLLGDTDMAHLPPSFPMMSININVNNVDDEESEKIEVCMWQPYWRRQWRPSAPAALPLTT